MIGNAVPWAHAVVLVLGCCGGELKSRLSAPDGGDPPPNCTEVSIIEAKPPLRPIVVAIAEREGFELELCILLLVITIIALLLWIKGRDGGSQGAGRVGKRVSVSTRHPVCR